MTPTNTKLDAMACLLGGVALLVISITPLFAIAAPEVQLPAKLVAVAYWLLGGLAIWWAVRRFAGLGERLAALVGVVIGWYIILQGLIMTCTMMTSGF